MGRKVRNIEEALAVLTGLNIGWVTVNRIQNSLWDTGVAFFGSNHGRVAYYDEVQEILSMLMIP